MRLLWNKTLKASHSTIFIDNQNIPITGDFPLCRISALPKGNRKRCGSLSWKCRKFRNLEWVGKKGGDACAAGFGFPRLIGFRRLGGSKRARPEMSVERRDAAAARLSFCLLSRRGCAAAAAAIWPIIEARCDFSSFIFSLSSLLPLLCRLLFFLFEVIMILLRLDSSAHHVRM